MKKVLFSLLASSALLFSACSEKFQVTAPYKDITAIYGFLDMADTAHYIRIQKAFLDESKSALTMAKEADSSFYANIAVRVERYRAAPVNGVNRYVDSFRIYRVDMAQEGYPKQPGTFFTAPNYAYKFTDALDPQYIYRIKVIHLNTGVIDSVDAPVIAHSGPSFQVDAIDNFNINNAGMDFYSVIGKKYYDFEATYVPTPGYNYNGEATPVRLAQAVIRFNWDDSDIVTKQRTKHYYDYDAGYATSSNNVTFSYKIDNRSLYGALSIGMGNAPANTVRLINRCDITMYLTTTDYANYRNALLVQGNGLTGSEISPLYTNIKGPNVLGLYTSRAVRSGPITITERTVDSLIASPLLTHTNLKGTAY